MAELEIGARWVLVDPTYGSFYTDAKGTKLGLSEIRALLTRGAVVKRAHRFVRYPNPLDVDKDNAGLAMLARNEPWTWFEAYSDPRIFLSRKSGGVVGPDRRMLFPLQLNLAIKNVLDAPMFGPSNQGADYIGAASPNQNQEWIVTGLSAGADYVFSLVPKDLHGYITANDRSFHLRAELDNGKLRGASSHVFDFSGGSAEPWEIRFTASAKESRIRLLHPYHGPDFRYMTMQRYSISKDERGVL